MLRLPLALFLLGSLGFLSGLPARGAEPRPRLRAHAHNDYEHPRPLLDALDQGFGSVEADIHLVGGQLLVAHDLPQTRPDRTLQALYLDPLRARVRANQGRVYRGGPTFTLLVDIKGDAEATYRRLREILADYREMLTAFQPDRTETGAVTLVLSGNRPWKMAEAESRRWVAIDGRLPDLDTNPSPHLVPLVSDNWRNHFQWNGEGPIPAEEAERLRTLVRRAHEQGRRIRFWAAADRQEVWSAHLAAGVDLINTDQLAALARFLESSTPTAGARP